MFAEGVGTAGADAAFVIVREELGFVGCDIYAHRAIAFASLAGEAEIERLFDFFTAPAVANDFTLSHLPEQVGAAAGGVFFVVCRAVAGTHHATFFAAAFADAHAAQCGVRQAALIGGKLEAGLRLPGSIVGAEAEIFVELVERLSRQTNDLAGIHFQSGSQADLNLRKACISSGPNILGEEFGAGLSVAVFAGEGAAVADDEDGGLFDELAEFGDAFFDSKSKFRRVCTQAWPKVAVERAFVAERGHHFSEIAEIAAEFFGGDGGVLPAFPVQRLTGHVRGDAEAGFTNLPDAFGLLAGDETRVGRTRAAVERIDQTLSLRLSFPRGLSAELDHEPASAFGQQGEAFGIDTFRAGVVDEEIVEAFESDGVVRHDFGDVVGALKDVGIGDD